MSIFPARPSAAPSSLLTSWQVPAMRDYKIRQIFERSYEADSTQRFYQPQIQRIAARAILNCKSGRLGFNLSQCTDCGHMEIHNNSCRNRNCPNCQAVQKEIWVDKRRAKVIDSPYFHVVFTLPHELNLLIYCNQKLLYGLFHKCCAETLLELSADKKRLGAVPGIIQVLHTWNQELAYHVHMHCIVSGGGLTKDGNIRKSSIIFLFRWLSCGTNLRENTWRILPSFIKMVPSPFHLPVKNYAIPITGRNGKISFMKWTGVPTLRETFNGFGNAIEYLGRYTHKVAISNNRILSLTQDTVTFSARGKSRVTRNVRLPCTIQSLYAVT